jgi:hypothetical protein
MPPHPPKLRKQILEWISSAAERTEVFTRLLLIANLIVVPIALALHKQWEGREFIERGILLFDLLGGSFLILSFLTFHFVLRNANRFWLLALGKRDYIALGRWFLGESSDELGSLHVTVRFASPDFAEVVTLLNHQAFKDSVFGITQDLLAERNMSFIVKNRRTFMLFYDPIRPSVPIGYSCLIPLTHEGERLYIGGRLKDADIPAACIAGVHGQAMAVLLFAAVVSRDFSLARGGVSGEYGPYFSKCLRVHFEKLLPQLYKSGNYPPVYIQTEKWAMRSRLRMAGFTPTGKRSGDGFDIYQVERPFSRPLEDQKSRSSGESHPTHETSAHPTGQG